MKNKGFTLIELLIVILIMIILFSMGLGVFKQLNKDRNLESSYLQLVNTLNEAKSSAIANIDKPCGENTLVEYRVTVYLSTPNAYALDAICENASGSLIGVEIKKIILPSDIIATSLNSDGSYAVSQTSIYFDTDGNSATSAGKKIIFSKDSNRTVTIQSNGAISTE